MNAPAKRFSLQRLLTQPAPVAEAVPALPPPPPAPVAVVPPAPAAAPVEAEVAAPSPARLVPTLVSRAPKAGASEEVHPKKKRSYSVDMKVCEDLEVLSWYQSRSSSSVVEELIRKYLQSNRATVMKAREIRSAR